MDHWLQQQQQQLNQGGTGQSLQSMEANALGEKQTPQNALDLFASIASNTSSGALEASTQSSSSSTSFESSALIFKELQIPVKDVQSYKEIRTRMVERVDSNETLTKLDFNKLFVDLRRTQDFARRVSLPDEMKLVLKDGRRDNISEHWRRLASGGLVEKNDDENFVKMLIYRQHTRSRQGYVLPSFADVRHWIGILFRKTLINLVQETKMYKNSKPRTRSELFIRLYILGKICGLDLEFHHTDFRSGQ